MRAALLQIVVDPDESAINRRARVSALVREQKNADLVLLPELWPVGAFAYDAWQDGAESVDGPTTQAMSAAAREARVWLHAGSIVERALSPSRDSGESGATTLYNTSLVFDPDGALRQTYRKIHRFGFDQGEAVLMGGGDKIVTAATPAARLGLATCYDLRFPEQFRLLVDAGADVITIPAGWPARRREHWLLLARARAVECQAYVLGCCTAGTHGGVEQAGHSVIVGPWGETLAEGGEDEQVIEAVLDTSYVSKVRAGFPVLRDRALGLPVPGRRPPAGS